MPNVIKITNSQHHFNHYGDQAYTLSDSFISSEENESSDGGFQES